MKKTDLKWLALLAMIFFSSCRNKTVQLLSKKWDCIKAENVVPVDPKFQSPRDSAVTAQLETILQSLNWTFKPNMDYECAVGNKVTIQGTYELLDDEKTLVCTPRTKNTVNRYTINTLTENDLVLSSSLNNVPVIMHFKPH